MKGPLIGGKDFEASIGQGEQVQGKVMEAYQRREEYLVWEKKKKKNECVRKRLVLMCEKVVHGKYVCKK